MYIVMKIGKTPLVIAFYEFVLWYLENGNQRELAQLSLLGNMHRWNKDNVHLSWDVTEENLRLLDRSVNESGTLDDETWTNTRNEFIVSAFKDLSTFRNPEAMSIFEKLRTVCTMNDGELMLWGRNVTKRSDGSAVIVLHVSDLEKFEKMLHRETGDGFLQEGLMIFR